MKRHLLNNLVYATMMVIGLGKNAALAQQLECHFKDPIIRIDFGNSQQAKNENELDRKKYQLIYGYCPNDGQFAVTSYTGDCFDGNWITLIEDHTPGDYLGKMMVVNAANDPGLFFVHTMTGLTQTTNYEIGAWMVNICRSGAGCTPTPPVINFIIETTNGVQLANFSTNAISPTGLANWQRYYGQFITPPGVSTIVLKMYDVTEGGCGNDFALDDITLYECRIKEPVVVKVPTPVTVVTNPKPSPPPAVTPPITATRKTVVTPAPNETQLKKTAGNISKNPVNEKPAVTGTIVTQQSGQPILPQALIQRSNPVIKQIITGEETLLVELYDNGEIDGDTVSIYHNNNLAIGHAGISLKPVTLHITVDAQHPHHELTMVAENLGSIPPNTSLMVITTASGKRYEIFISSSEQKNARVVIDLKD